jgi:hypothetical protein
MNTGTTNSDGSFIFESDVISSGFMSAIQNFKETANALEACESLGVKELPVVASAYIEDDSKAYFDGKHLLVSWTYFIRLRTDFKAAINEKVTVIRLDDVSKQEDDLKTTVNIRF